MAGESWTPRAESSPSRARVTRTAVNTLRRTPITSKTAKPRTEPVASAKRIKAVMSVVMFPSRMARKPLS